MVGGGRPLLPEMLGQTDPVGAKRQFSNDGLRRILAKKVQLTLIGSQLRVPVSL